MSTHDIVRTVGSGVTIITAIVLVSIYVAKLEGRVDRLEEQLRALSVASNNGNSGAQDNKLGGSFADKGYEVYEYSGGNPIPQKPSRSVDFYPDKKR